MAGNVGRVLPAQLGRLIRPEAMVRLGRGTLSHCLKAEASVFVLDAISVFALLAGLVVFRFRPLLAPVVVVAFVAVCLYLGGRIGDALAGTKLDLPRGFWWQWQTAATVVVQMAGWVAHGLAFYVLIAGLVGLEGLWDALFTAPAAAVLGTGTGLPGGIGATEGLLGAALRLSQVPAEHLALIVAAFRVVTFWCWVAVGWVFLASIRRKVARARRAAPVAVVPEPYRQAAD
jgi:uncharacterized membrane protein YbhN (UPF0104 family)